MRQISRVMEVSLSNLAVQSKPSKKSRPARYEKADDEIILPLIKEITDARPTYGYRRVGHLLNARLVKDGKRRVNHKRIYRIMEAHNLLLQRYTGKPTRTHDGKIITQASNMRWCSDGFTIQCWNSERVHVAFSLDTCDREAIRHLASTIGVDGAMVRDLMLEIVEVRFGNAPAPFKIQWLSDYGPGFVANETVAFARTLNLEPCTTPAYSPESNGMADAFVKTFKRDYVFLNDLSSARVVMKQLPHWFEDYNEMAPHKGLKMLSPREYRRRQEEQKLAG